ITVSELLAILKITKQSLSRVLSALVDSDHVVQKTGPEDRRQRLLYLTDSGTALESRLTEVQGRRFAKAYRDAGMTAVEGFQRVLEGLLDLETQRQVDALGHARKARHND
ncbi:MAG: MarR family winged helix-turn-helix transcriptional regulator, partial [Candidatus Puniceispirillaceae bacterium]